MVEKTTKWKTNEKYDPLASLAPVAQTPTAKPELTALPEMQRTAVASVPDIEEYLPLDANGEPKEDGKKRMLVLIEPDVEAGSSRIMPVRWFNMSKVEVSIAAAELTRIMAMEMAVDSVSREEEFQAEVDRQVLAILRQRVAEKSEAI